MAKPVHETYKIQAGRETSVVGVILLIPVSVKQTLIQLVVNVGLPPIPPNV